MLIRNVRLGFAPLATIALLAANAAAPPTAGPRASARPQVRVAAPPAPPDGTYVYAISRNGTDQGKTTVVLFRRNAERALETDESGFVGTAQIHVLAQYRYADLGPDAYVATYEAPFLRTSPLGSAERFRPHPSFDDQTTVRYRVDGVDVTATIDGVPGNQSLPLLPGGAKAPVHARWVFDAPFMTSVLLLPAFRRAASDAALAPLSLAFGDALPSLAAEKLERDTPAFLKTPKTDLVLNVAGVAHVWFDPATYVVHEAHFDALNLDARLVSYTKAAIPAPFVPAPAATPEPHGAADEVTFASDDGTTLSGVLDAPPGNQKIAGGIVFIPPAPDATRNYDANGPEPMYPALAHAFAARGYETLRYDARGSGRSRGSSLDATWQHALEDAVAAVAFLESDEGIDAKNVYLAGYGVGADLAFAASSTPNVDSGGVIALGPTVVRYTACARGQASSVGTPSSGASWQKSLAPHDPRAVAARSRLPSFVLHPGVPRCGETPDQVAAYDAKLRAANPLATVLVASDLSERFGGRYDANSAADTEEFFPYRFDASTATAIADWLDSPKNAAGADGSRLPNGTGARAAPPPPPPQPEPPNENSGGMPNPHASAEPGVVLPSGATPPPLQAAPPTPSAAPT